MRVLIVGLDRPGALEQYCEKGLRQLGHAVEYYDLYENFVRRSRFRQTPVLNEVEQAVRKGPYNRQLVERVKRTRPDLVLVFKGIELLSSTLRHLRALPNRPILANWNPDNPFDLSPSNTSRELIASVPTYDMYFMWDRDLFSPLREIGARRVEYLPFGYDPDEHHPVELSETEREALHSQACFVGGYTPERASLLAHLTGYRLGLWGTDWHRLPADSPLHGHLRGGWTHGQAMSKVFSAADMVLNFIRPQNGQAHNMRTFEVPATGAMMLSTRTRDQVGWLAEGKAAAYFATPEEMVEGVAYYLGHQDEHADLALTGHRLITEGEHTYYDRMRQLTQVIEAL